MLKICTPEILANYAGRDNFAAHNKKIIAMKKYILALVIALIGAAAGHRYAVALLLALL